MINFLYKTYDEWRNHHRTRDLIAKLPEYIAENLNKNFELREYQRQAFENFITHFEDNECPHPTQVLFHMATGSGKTLIMAGLIIYLYKRGYRNFLFFVNLTNILEKTRENFLNQTSAKYLFADEIIIDGEKIRINAVENFQNSDDDAINICFETTQKLHDDIFFNNAKENKMTLDDFEDKKIVLISDEAHHLNVGTRGGNNTEANWESSVRKIFEMSAENILLEFTATCDLENEHIKNFYEDKIIFNYPLLNFYKDGYSKEIISLRSDFSLIDKSLQAIILSQYRLKIFQDNRLSIKPIILFKTATINDNKNFMKKFLDEIKNLNGDRLRELSKKFNGEIMQRAFEYFRRKEISFEMLATELQDDFSEPHCLSTNNDNDAEKNQLLLNSLEDKNNPYRAIFEVKKLDEGWDVLNLFDIVRLYETRQSGGKKISPSTIAEAQLIGRGARYCPFKIDDDLPKFQRKFDSDVNCELRICETLFYHCQNDSRYIGELKKALHKIGLEMDKKFIERKYILKQNFKSDDLYNRGIIFLNKRIELDRKNIFGLSEEIRNKIYTFTVGENLTNSDNLIDEENPVEKNSECMTKIFTVAEIAKINYAFVHKALMKYPIYKFDILKKIFPNLNSTREFITDEKYLGEIKIQIKSSEKNFSAQTFYNAVFDVLGKISQSFSKVEKNYIGTKEFSPQSISEIFGDKTVSYSQVHEGGIGFSQNDSTVEDFSRFDLSKEDWFAYTDNFGTSEEKAFVAYFRNYVEDLKKIYDKIFLVRNERAFHIYSFDDGARFEPDYVLFLQKNDGENFEQLQIFIEPKGTHLLEKDAWKEKFLLQLKDKAEIFFDDDKYKIWGFHFFNRDERAKIFEEDFFSLNNSFA